MHKRVLLVLLASATLFFTLSCGFPDETALVKKDTGISKVIRSLVEMVKDLLKKFPGSNLVVTVLSAIPFVKDSYQLTIDARRELEVVEFEMKEFYMIMKTEISPMFQTAAMILENDGNEMGMKKFCEGKHPFITKLERKIEDLRSFRKYTEHSLTQRSRRGGILESVLADLISSAKKDKEKILKHLQSEAMTAEEMLRKLGSEIDKACIKFMMGKPT